MAALELITYIYTIVNGIFLRRVFDCADLC